MKSKSNLHKHLLAGAAALIALVTYILTMAPTVSFWDCGEFIACANILGIPHPPGTPFFVIFARAVIVALPFVEEIAKRVNYISVFTSAATIYVVFLFIWDLLSKFLRADVDGGAAKITESTSTFIKASAAFAGSLLLTFSDTFWFSAVEAEVYGFAMLLVVLVSYLALVWSDHQGTGKGERLLIMICYLAFLGVGIHLYTLLTIPAVFLFLLIADESKMKAKLLGAGFFVLVLGGVVLGWVLLGKGLESANLSLPMPLFPVFGLLIFWKIDPAGIRIPNWPMWFTGVVLYSAVYRISSFPEWSFLIFFGLLALRYLTPTSLRPDLRISQWFAAVAIIGFSTHAYIPIRSALDPRIDENNPEIALRFDGKFDIVKFWSDDNWKAFNDFVERKQYGSESMLSRAFYRRGFPAHQLLTFPHMGYGGYQVAQYLPYSVGFVQYYQPGMYQVDPEENAPWEGLGLTIPTQMMSIGDNVPMQLFWFLLFNVPIGWACLALYRRRKAIGIYTLALYLITSAGLIFYINFADGMRLENRDREQWMQSLERERGMLAQQGAQIPSIPDPNNLIRIRHELSKPGANRPKLESHPDWQVWRRIQNAYTTAGYRAPEIPSPVHLEVRERDYFYSPAYIFMSLILGVGVGLLLLALLRSGRAGLVRPVGAILALLCAFVPAYSNWEEHDRSGLYVPWDYAYNLIMSCLPNSVLFTNGDNDTFPLWFIQEVENIRQDVRVVNLSLGNTDWYIHQILEIEPTLKLSYTHEEIDSRLVFSESNMRHADHQVDTWVRRAESAVPVLKRRAELLTAQLDSTEIDPSIRSKSQQDLSRVNELIQLYDGLLAWGERRRGGFMKTQDRLVLDIVQNNPDRPIHFATTVSSPNMVGLEKYMIMEGMVYTLQKGNLELADDRIHVERTRQLVDSVYKYRGLGDGSAYINDETMRLLFTYNSIYLRLSLEGRSTLLRHTRPDPETGIINESARDSSLAVGIQYMEMAMTQFPQEWRNYAVASELLELAGQFDKAIAILEKGVAQASGRGQQDLVRRLESLRGRPQGAPSIGG